MAYDDWLERLMTEYNGVRSRMERLSAFLDDPANAEDIGAVQWEMLREQATAMAQYQAVLAARIREAVV